MEQTEQYHCHRCGHPLDAASLFCAQCGAPQLQISQFDIVDSTSDGSTAEQHGEAPSPAALPGQPPDQLQHGVQWKSAIIVSLAVSSAAGVLCILALAAPALSTVCFFWVVSASLIALALYRRRVPMAWIDSGVGARIGMLVGIFTACVPTAVSACFLLLMRYAWHRSAPFDAQITSAISQGMARAAESNPDPQVLQSTTALLLSPEGRAGYMLAFAIMLGAFILGFSIVSGAVGAKLIPAPRRPAA